MHPTVANYRQTADYQADPWRAERILSLSAGLLLRLSEERQGDSLAAAHALVDRLTARGTDRAQAQELVFLAADYLRTATEAELLAAYRSGTETELLAAHRAAQDA